MISIATWGPLDYGQKRNLKAWYPQGLGFRVPGQFRIASIPNLRPFG